METNEKDNVVENKVETLNENNFSSADILPEGLGAELDLGEEIASEKEISEVKDYSHLAPKALLDELKNLVEKSAVEKIRKDVEAIKDAFDAIVRQNAENQEKNDGEETVRVNRADSFEKEFRQYLKRYKEKRTEFLRNSESQKEENYKCKLAIINELKDLINEEETLANTFNKFHDIQSRWKETGPVHQNYVKDLWETWHHNVEKFYDYVKINKELRDFDLKRNWDLKNEIIQKAELLLESRSISEAFAQLQTYHDEWREIGPVQRDLKDGLWERFRDITSKLNKRYQAYFDVIRAERQRNLQMKSDLCERLEKINATALATSKDWQKASADIVAILGEWKTIGFVPKKENNEIFLRLKKARDEFFAKRQVYYKTSRQEMGNAIKAKKELCEKAEALQYSEDWKEVTDKLIELQKQWKETGAVPRKHSTELWSRFRKACDIFFNRKVEFFAAKEDKYADNLRAKEEIIAELEKFEPDNSHESIEMLRQFRLRWNDAGFVPIKIKNKIQRRFSILLDQKYKSLRVSDAERKVMHFKDKIESAGNKYGKMRGEREKLVGKINYYQNEIALLENNIGFFANTKNAEALIADVRKKIDKHKEDISTMEEQLKLLDKDLNKTSE
ncbi:MAG: DUF349 domain-containing protein [Prevotellaceae bacterium]|nr:DUF349 domain-containing protein [Prevotellaceae bacterium]